LLLQAMLSLLCFVPFAALAPLPTPPKCPGRPRRVAGAAQTGTDGAERTRAFLTTPDLGSCPESIAQSPLQVVILSSGFNAPPALYFLYAEALAMWGCAVIQPWRGFGFLPPPEMDEANWVPALIEWARSLRGTPHLNTTHLAAVGHSKGGNIAALQHAVNAGGVTSSFLMDPVACGIEFAPCLSDSDDLSAPYLYGPATLAGLPSGVAAAGELGSANNAVCICPEEYDEICPPTTEGLCSRPVAQSELFWNATASGSPRFTVVDAGHEDFLTQPTINITIPLMLAALGLEPASIDDWLAQKVSSGQLAVDWQ